MLLGKSLGKTNTMTEQLLARIDALADHLLPPILNENPPPKEEPDTNTIKMFVGQIPRVWDEQVLTLFFEEFGPVYQINVLRNKETNQSRGCCFVTFYSRKAALEAQNALHNIKTLPGMRHPIQMKPANHETMNDKKKLFVGMLSKRYDENDLRDMFSSFGHIEDCSIIKDSNGQSKGCAFITFTSRQDALDAIKSMHQSQTMDGCQSPLVVKLADTQKEKDAKKQQQMFMNFLSAFKPVNPSVNSHKFLSGSLTGAFPGFSNSARSPYSLNFEPYGTGDAENMGLQLNGKLYLPVSNPLTGQNVSPAFALSNRENISANTAIPQMSSANFQSLAALATLARKPALNTVTLQNIAVLAAAAAAHNQVGTTGQMMASANVNPVATSSAITNIPLAISSSVVGGSSSMAAGNANYNTLNQLPDLQSLEYISSFLQKTPTFATKQVEGPEGANLFIYHLPSEYTDADLAQAFMPFGNVISAKVFIDKNTHLSKCFGFVSYDDPAVALTAIKAMNGIQIGTKRLKVQLKQSKEATKPY